MYARVFVEPIGGVAGDMLLAALIDLGADLGRLRAAIESLGVPGLQLEVSRVELAGEAACYVRSLAPDEGEHAHRHLDEILAVVQRGALSAAARARAERTFTILAEAEAVVHGGTAGEVHLHEVGQLDSILDVVGVAVALDLLGNPRLACAPLPSGGGTVLTSHGEMACPVPAVVELARRFSVPLEPVPLFGETITPTGVALLCASSDELSATKPASAPQRVGVGAGTRRYADRPNVVRLHGYGGRPPPAESPS